MGLSQEGTVGWREEADLSNSEVTQETSESKSKLTPMTGDRVGSGIHCLIWGGGQRSSLGHSEGGCGCAKENEPGLHIVSKMVATKGERRDVWKEVRDGLTGGGRPGQIQLAELKRNTRRGCGQVCEPGNRVKRAEFQWPPEPSCRLESETQPGLLARKLGPDPHWAWLQGTGDQFLLNYHSNQYIMAFNLFDQDLHKEHISPCKLVRMHTQTELPIP